MAYRQFTDSTGAEWTVYDVVPRADERRGVNRRQGEPPAEVEERRGEDRRLTVGGMRPVRLTQGWLCFEKQGERRRLQPIPVNWHLLPDVDLGQLIEQARLAPQPKRPDHGAGSPQR